MQIPRKIIQKEHTGSKRYVSVISTLLLTTERDFEAGYYRPNSATSFGLICFIGKRKQLFSPRSLIKWLEENCLASDSLFCTLSRSRLYIQQVIQLIFCSNHFYTPVPPVVRVHQTKPADYGKQSMLECSVVGFFPQEVWVSWLKDGVEVTTDVSSTDILPNGDWSFQLHSYLELTPRRGERVSCRVDHSSLRESLEVDWGKD